MDILKIDNHFINMDNVASVVFEPSHECIVANYDGDSVEPYPHDGSKLYGSEKTAPMPVVYLRFIFASEYGYDEVVFAGEKAERVFAYLDKEAYHA